MKRRRLMKHLNRYQCVVKREGRLHTIVVNLLTGAESQVPRHAEIKAFTAREICKELAVPVLAEK